MCHLQVRIVGDPVSKIVRKLYFRGAQSTDRGALRPRERERETDRDRDRETDRQTDRQTDKILIA